MALQLQVQDTVTKEVTTITVTELIAILDDSLALKATTPVISSGTAAPETTPGKIGDVYIDTAAGKSYFAKGATASTDWIIQN